MGGHNGQFWGIFWVGDFLTISNKQLNFSLFVTRVEDVEDIYQREFPEFRIFVNRSITIGIPAMVDSSLGRLRIMM